MNILLLGPERGSFQKYLSSFGDKIISVEDKLSDQDSVLEGTDFIISYGYRYLIKKPILDLLPNKVINLHISYLPWNRGADPNLWSILEDTPKGVTIHHVDEGLDTGDIIVQRKVHFCYSDYTLASSYELLNNEIIKLFKLNWPLIRQGKAERGTQPAGGSFHFSKDKEKIDFLLTAKGWDTPVTELIGTFKSPKILF